MLTFVAQTRSRGLDSPGIEFVAPLLDPGSKVSYTISLLMDGTTPDGIRNDLETRFARICAYACTALMVAPYVYHLALGTGDHLMLVTDDFYYYAMVAKNAVTQGRLTFDGITSTNGFHPLFMAVLMPLTWIAGGINPLFFALLTCVFLAAGIATFELYLALGRRVFPGTAFAPVAAALASLAQMRMIVWGMETTLAVPLYLFTLLELAKTESLTPRRASWLGFVCSLLVLARLDHALFVALLGVSALAFARGRVPFGLRTACAFAVGGILVPVYLGWNLLEFGGLMPVSAQAKQLKHGFGFGQYLLQNLWESGYVKLALLLLPPALLAFAAGGSRLLVPAGRLVTTLALGYPILFYATLGLSSDWRMFGWYLYPVPTALFFSALVLVRFVSHRVPFEIAPRVAAGLSVVGLALAIAVAGRVCYTRTLGWGEVQRSYYDFALRLRDETRDVDGIFAMGDRAGLTAFLLEKPVVQLEGLVADATMIDHIRNEHRLEDVLREYGVDYLIVLRYQAIGHEDGCYEVSHPDFVQAGPRSKKMIGRFCQEPILQITRQYIWDPVYPQDYYVYVFDVRLPAVSGSGIPPSN